MNKQTDDVFGPKVSQTQNQPWQMQIFVLFRVLIIKPFTSRTVLKSKFDQETERLNNDISILQGQLKCAEDARDLAIKERDAAQTELSFLIAHPQQVTYIIEQRVENMVGSVTTGATGIQLTK